MMMKKSMFVFNFAIFIGTAATAQDLALGQKIDMSLFTKTNEKLADSNQTVYRMISPENSRFLEVDWDEITVNALPDGTITVIRYSEKGNISENVVRARFLAFMFYVPRHTEYTESKDIKFGGALFPRFLKPGDNEGVTFFGDLGGIDIIFSIDAGNFERAFAQASKDAESRSSSSTPRPASPPRQQEGSISDAGEPSSSGSSSGGSNPSGSRRSSSSSVDFGFTAHLNVYLQGWHQNLAAFGPSFQLGMELGLPVVTLDILGEAGVGLGYGNLIEYRLGGMGELYFFKKIGFGAGMDFYGSAMNWGSRTDSSGKEVPIYAAPIKTMYNRFALIFRGKYKTSLYAELYGDKKWGFGMMWGRVLTD
jgi:hypothetical protein